MQRIPKLIEVEDGPDLDVRVQRPQDVNRGRVEIRIETAPGTET